jgi:hypothetical protein
MDNIQNKKNTYHNVILFQHYSLLHLLFKRNVMQYTLCKRSLSA